MNYKKMFTYLLLSLLITSCTNYKAISDRELVLKYIELIDGENPSDESVDYYLSNFNYYGTYDKCTQVFSIEEKGLSVTTNIFIDDAIIPYNLNQPYAYFSDNFYSLKEAYDDNLLSINDVYDIEKKAWNNNFNTHYESFYTGYSINYEYDISLKLSGFSEDFKVTNYFCYYISPSTESITTYKETIGDLVFCYPNEYRILFFKLYTYASPYLTLKEAYENGEISYEELCKIHKRYNRWNSLYIDESKCKEIDNIEINYDIEKI